MIILGISGGFFVGNQDASACILKDGRIEAAIAEERLCGEKFARGRMPTRAIEECLAICGIEMDAVDYVATTWKTYSDFLPRLKEYLQFRFGHCPTILQYDHHLAHAASAYHASGFADSLIATYDLSGDNTATAIWRGRGRDIALIERIERPHSLGIFYSMITQFLGFDRDSDEYKVMGLAAYGEPTFDLSPLLRPDGHHYRLNLDYTRYARHDFTGNRDEFLFGDRLAALLKLPQRRGGPITAEHMNLAAATQAALEDRILALLDHHRGAGDRLCVAGGVGLNCSANGMIERQGWFEDIFVQPAAGDDGLSLGCAYLAAAEQDEPITAMADAYLGSAYEADAIKAILTLTGTAHRELQDPAAEAAQRLAQGQIVGWFQGRMEFGPRALGNRSILADAGRPGMKDEINSRVKFREEFRPFAPSCLVEDNATYFACARENPYMTMAVRTKPAAQDALPATTHVNGTARVQTVDTRRNPLYHELIRRFKALTGQGAVLNTSLNLMGQPLACRPQDALRAFASSGMDSLILDRFLITKR